MLLRAAQPCPALFAISSFPMAAGALSVNVTGRLYGPDADAVAARERRAGTSGSHTSSPGSSTDRIEH